MATLRQFLLGMALFVAACTSPTIDIPLLEDEIENWSEDNFGAPAGSTTVDCPEEVPAEAGYRFICTLDDPTGVFSVRVTVLNENGDVEWELLG